MTLSILFELLNYLPQTLKHFKFAPKNILTVKKF